MVKRDIRGIQRSDNIPRHRIFSGFNPHVLHILVEHVAGIVSFRVHGAGSQHHAVGNRPKHIQNKPVGVGAGGIIFIQLGDQRTLRRVCKGNSAIQRGHQRSICARAILMKL